MAGPNDPLLDIIGYRDISQNGVLVARRRRINFLGGSVADNGVDATDVNVGGLAVGDSTLAASADVPVSTMNLYDGSAVATYTFPATPLTGDTIGMAEVTGGTSVITFDGNGNNIADPTASGVPAATMAVNQARASIFWQFDGTTWILQGSPITPVGGGGVVTSVSSGNTTIITAAPTTGDVVVTAVNQIISAVEGNDSAFYGIGSGVTLAGSAGGHAGFGNDVFPLLRIGDDSAGLGHNVFVNLDDGNNVIGIGANLGTTLTEGTDVILIGEGLDVPAATTNNYMSIADLLFADLDDQAMRIGGTGVVANEESVSLELAATTKALKLNPLANVAAVATPQNGMAAYSNANANVQVYQNSAWIGLGPSYGTTTGLLTGGAITINGGNPALIDIAAGVGFHVDDTDPRNPITKIVPFGPFTAQALPDIATTIFTPMAIDSAGTLIDTGALLATPATRRSAIRLQVVEHRDNATITNIGFGSQPAWNLGQALLDQALAVGAVISGNTYGAAASDLTIAKTVGDTTLPFINYHNDTQNPNTLNNPADSPHEWIRSFRDNVAVEFEFSGIVTTVDAANYDDGIAAAPVAVTPTNRFTIKRIYFFGQANETVITEGQAIYTSLDIAEAAIFSEAPAIDPLVQLGIFRAALIVRANATDLSDSAQARFVTITTDVSSSSTSVSWGDIIGTLADQTDLQAALDLKLDLGGGTMTGAIAMGTNAITGTGSISTAAGTSTIGSSVTDYYDDVWIDAVNANGPALAAYGLNATGTNAGAYAIGINPTLLANATATDLMTALDELDTAITGGGTSWGGITGTLSSQTDLQAALDLKLALGGGTMTGAIAMGTNAITGTGSIATAAGTSTIGSSVTDYYDDVWIDAVNANGPALAAYGLNATGTNAGAYAIGINPTLLANATATDLMTALDELDAAITGGGGNNLQQAYVLNNLIDVDTSEGPFTVQNDTDTANAVLINRLFAGAGHALAVTMGPGNEAVTGDGINVTTGTAASGRGIFVNHLGTGPAVLLQVGTTDVFEIDADGGVALTAIADEDLVIATAGTGTAIFGSLGTANAVLNAAGASGDAVVNSANAAVNLQIASATKVGLTAAGAVAVTPTSAQNFTVTTAGGGAAVINAYTLPDLDTDTFSFPDANGVAGSVLTDIAGDGVLTFAAGSASSEFSDSLFRIQDNADDTREIAFEASGITTGTTRTITVPDSNLTLLVPAGLAGGQTIVGDTASGGDLTLESTSNGTKGSVVLAAGTDLDLSDEDVVNARTITFGATPETQTTASATLTIDWNLNQKQHANVDQTVTAVAFTNPLGTGNFTLVVEQDGGSFELSGWDGDIVWLGGTDPTFLDADGSFRILSFYWDGTRYFGEFNLGTYS